MQYKPAKNKAAKSNETSTKAAQAPLVAVKPDAGPHYVAIGNKGITAIPAHVSGKSAKVIAERMPAGFVLGKNIKLEATRTGQPIATIPVNEQPPFYQFCGWVSSRGDSFQLHELSAAVKAGIVKLVPARIGETVETLVLPTSYKAGHKLPKCVAVVPSKSWPHGKVESRRIADGRNDGVVSAVSFSAASKSTKSASATKPATVKPPVKTKSNKELAAAMKAAGGKKATAKK